MKILNYALLFTISLFTLNAQAGGYSERYTYNGLEGKIINNSNIPNEDLRVVARICKWKWYRKCSLKKSKSDIAEDGSFKLKGKKTSYKKWEDDIFVTHYIYDKKTEKKYQMERKMSGRVLNLKYTEMDYILNEDLSVETVDVDND